MYVSLVFFMNYVYVKKRLAETVYRVFHSTRPSKKCLCTKNINVNYGTVLDSPIFLHIHRLFLTYKIFLIVQETIMYLTKRIFLLRDEAWIVVILLAPSPPYWGRAPMGNQAKMYSDIPHDGRKRIYLKAK